MHIVPPYRNTFMNFLQLSLNKLKVPSPLAQELLMATSLLDVSILDDMDDIAASDGTQAMSDGDGRSGKAEKGSAPSSLDSLIRTYRPLLALSSAICTDFSDCASSALVASAETWIRPRLINHHDFDVPSNNKILGFLIRARAMQSRWRCPPLRLAPFMPISVSRPFSSPQTKSQMLRKGHKVNTRVRGNKRQLTMLVRKPP